MSAFCSGLADSISKCCYDFYHAPFTRKNLMIGGGVMLGLIILIIIIVCSTRSGGISDGSEVIKKYPLVDGANSLSNNIKNHFGDQLSKMPALTKNLTKYFSDLKCDSCQTDFSRLKKGYVSTQIFSVSSTDCDAQFKDAVSQTLEQIDLINRMVADPTNKLSLVNKASDISKLHGEGKTGVIINIWGGHNIDSRLAVLRMFYNLGARVMALVTPYEEHICTPPWITDKNLTSFGEKVISEMNRLGIIIDLTGCNADQQESVLKVTKAPVIFSHSGSKTVTNNPLNIEDYILKTYGKNDTFGLIMIPFSQDQISPNSSATLDTIAQHMDEMLHFIDHTKLGIGSNFDNFTSTIKNLEDVSKFPVFFDHLFKRASPKYWDEDNLERLASQNFINVFSSVEKVSSYIKPPADDSLCDKAEFDKDDKCYTDGSVRYVDIPTVPPSTVAPSTVAPSTTVSTT